MADPTSLSALTVTDSGLVFQDDRERDLWLDVYKSAMRLRFTQFPDGTTLEMIPELKADDAIREYRQRLRA